MPCYGGMLLNANVKHDDADTTVLHLFACITWTCCLKSHTGDGIMPLLPHLV